MAITFIDYDFIENYALETGISTSGSKRNSRALPTI